MIALVGSPFSSAYARAGRDPLRYSALNVALYGPNGSSWSLTERSITPADRAGDGVAIGRSAMRWRGDSLAIDIDERRAPFGGPLRGAIRLHPETITTARIGLDAERDARHSWWPIAPRARIEVELDGIRFQGHGYHDANAGDAPLATAFDSWTWSRARTREGSLLTYDVVHRDGQQTQRALLSGATLEPIADPLPASKLARTRWRLDRGARGERVELVRDLEDTPFYARSLVRSRFRGEDVTMMHETMSCSRLATPWVRFLLPFRTRRA